jgi:hypothetical protein
VLLNQLFLFVATPANGCTWSGSSELAATLFWLEVFFVSFSQNPPAAWLTWISPFLLTPPSGWILVFLLAWRPMLRLRPFAAFLISPAYKLIVVS